MRKRVSALVCTGSCSCAVRQLRPPSVDTSTRLHLAAPRPREPGDLVVAAVEQHLAAGRRRDHALRLLDPRVLAVLAAGHQVDVVQRFLARVPRRVADLDAAQPLDARHALHAGHEQAQRIALLGPQHLAVLAVADQDVVERHRQRDRARQRRAVGAFGEHELRLRRSTPTSSSSVDSSTPVHSLQPIIPCEYCTVGTATLRPFHAGVRAALDEVDARHRREAHQVVHRVDARLAHHAVDHQPVLVRIDLGHARRGGARSAGPTA